MGHHKDKLTSKLTEILYTQGKLTEHRQAQSKGITSRKNRITDVITTI
jgi:hypothetical protein